jgi:cytochrome c oxidase subunit 6b
VTRVCSHTPRLCFAQPLQRFQVKTAPFDPRFPSINQAKTCFTRYNEYHKCAKEKGEDNAQCQQYAKYYRSICPTEWVDKWNEQRENGNWAGRY